MGGDGAGETGAAVAKAMAEGVMAEAVMVAVTAEGAAWGGWASVVRAAVEETGQEGREKVEPCVEC